MKTITQAECTESPAAYQHASTLGPVTVVGENGEPMFVLSVPRGRLPVVGEHDGLDPADDAAWPLPEGWRWNGRVAWRFSDLFTVWIVDGGLQFLRASAARVDPVPLAVVRTLLARWEAGQA